MIVGNGDIAGVLNDREGIIFFAAGVSNSNETRYGEFAREIPAISKYLDNEEMFVYFSSIKIFTDGNDYYQHKIAVEDYVRSWFDNYCIIRLGNINWGKNPNTFLNYIRAKKAKGEPVEIRDEWKYMISKEELLFITDNLPLKGRHEICVFGEMKKVKDLI